jgi:hypothetical protein
MYVGSGYIEGQGERVMLLVMIGLILFVVGLVALVAGAVRAPAAGAGAGGPSGDALLIGGAIGVVFGVGIAVAGLL